MTGGVAAPPEPSLPSSPPHGSASLSLYRWIFPESDEPAAAELCRAAGLPLTVARLLAARGVRSAEQARQFLSPSLDDLLDPYTMRGMAEAVGRVQAAIVAKQPILIYGDYDADGATAIVLLKTAIEMLGGKVEFHVPHRIREGYGMQEGIVAAAAARGVRLVISVDSGIRDFAVAEAAARLGVDLIVTDHHLPESAEAGAEASAAGRLPSALAILNPNQPECGYASKHICGAGVAFKLAQALLEARDPLRARSKILPSFLKMLAIATVADAVPLVGENRVFVALGLEQLRRPAHPGLRRLLALARLSPGQRPTAADIAFRVAPRINAAGRMDVAGDVVELFTTRDGRRAVELAEKLDRLNGERRQAEAAVLDQIERRLEADAELSRERCLVIDGEGWHRGILGILASRVVESRGRPALIVARNEDEAHGSGRSVPGFHLLEAIESCREIFTRFGGHAHAVGFSLPSERLAELRQRLQSWAELHHRPQPPALCCAAELPLDQITPALWTHLRRLEPFGMGNEEPVFVARGLLVAAPLRVFKDRHVELKLAPAVAAAAGRPPIFSAVGWDWAKRVEAAGLAAGASVDLAFRVREKQYLEKQQREKQQPGFGGLELEIADLRWAQPAGASF